MLYKRVADIPLRLKGRVAIKLHMGERGNKTHLFPRDVGTLVKKIERGGGKPFLVDTPVLYPGSRYTAQSYRKVARENGFGKFEVVISEDYKKVKGFRVAREIVEADSLLVLTHATGHISMGFAGTIKNLGMGGVSRGGKRKIHAPSRPKYNASVCTQCGTCVRECSFNFLHLQGRLKLKLGDCPACGRCVDACPSGALWKPADAEVKTFDLLMRAAKAVISPFERSEVTYITVLKNITEFCDCTADVGSLLCEDIGYLTAENPFKLDRETARLIRERNQNAFDPGLWSKFEAVAKKHW